MNARPADRLAIALAQLNPTVGDVAGNTEKVRARARPPPRMGADLVIVSRAVHRRLSARGSGAEAGVPGRLPRGGRGAGARDRRRRPGAARRHAVGRGRQALQRLCCCSTAARSRPLRFKVDLPNYGVFDEKRVFAPGPLPGPVIFKGVRIGIPVCEDIWQAGRGRVHRGDRRRNPAGAERLAVLARQDRDVASTSRCRAWSRAACRSSISTWSADRTNWCSTARRSRSTPTARSRSSFRRSRETVVADALGARATARGVARGALRRRCSRRATRRDYAACVLGPARLRRQERLQGRGVRPVGRHRLARCAPRWRSTRWARIACAP